jgi:hypothetical protein
MTAFRDVGTVSMKVLALQRSGDCRIYIQRSIAGCAKRVGVRRIEAQKIGDAKAALLIDMQRLLRRLLIVCRSLCHLVQHYAAR